MMVFLSLPENHPILNGLVQRVPIKMFAMLGFRQLSHFEDYVKDMQAIAHDYVLMGLDLKTDEEYAGVGG